MARARKAKPSGESKAKKTSKAKRKVSSHVKAAADRAEARADGKSVPDREPIASAPTAASEPDPSPAGPEKRDATSGRFLPGNKFWEARSSAGPKPKFANPDDLWKACCEYFEWVDSNPLWEDKLITFQGSATHEPVAKMRAMTQAGLCLFIDIDRTTWAAWRTERPDLAPVVTRVEEVIYSQKFAGAAGDLLNANIIARDLGLVDKVDTPAGGGLATTFAVTMSALAQLAVPKG